MLGFLVILFYIFLRFEHGCQKLHLGACFKLSENLGFDFFLNIHTHLPKKIWRITLQPPNFSSNYYPCKNLHPQSQEWQNITIQKIRVATGEKNVGATGPLGGLGCEGVRGYDLRLHDFRVCRFAA